MSVSLIMKEVVMGVVFWACIIVMFLFARVDTTKIIIEQT